MYLPGWGDGAGGHLPTAKGRWWGGEGMLSTYLVMGTPVNCNSSLFRAKEIADNSQVKMHAF